MNKFEFLRPPRRWHVHLIIMLAKLRAAAIYSPLKGVMRMKKLGALDWIALILVIVGGLNWGLVGAFKFDLVAAIFGDMSIIARIVYILVGLSAIYGILMIGKLGKK